MPNMVTRQMTYTDDISGTQRVITFKIKEQYADIQPAYLPPDGLPKCSTQGLFKPRAAVALFPTGERIKFPLPDSDFAANRGRLILLRDAGALCIDIVGEEWRQIAGSTVPIPSYTVPDGFSDKTGGIMTYASDVAGADQQVRVNYEIAPIQLSAVVADCVGTLIVGGVCTTQLGGFKTRRVIMTAQNAVTNGAFVRAAPVTTIEEVPNCITAAQAVTPCVGYKGESVRNAHLYLPAPAPETP